MTFEETNFNGDGCSFDYEVKVLLVLKLILLVCVDEIGGQIYK